MPPARKDKKSVDELREFVRGIVRMVIEEIAEHPEVGLPPLLRAKDVAKLLRIGHSTMNRALAKGTFVPPPFLTHPYRWRRVDLQAYITGLPKKKATKPDGKPGW